MLIDKELGSIIDEYWRDFQEKKMLDFVAKPSIPIIWFGNIELYLKSSRRVLTIAINPSDKEFRRNNKENFSLFRFPESETICDNIELNNDDKILLCKSYNNYFTDDRTYKRWFTAYEKLLNYLNTSYYNNHYRNHAIHIDAFTGISTSKTWGKLSKEEKTDIANIPLFKRLLSYLKPDIVLISINIPTFNEIFNPSNTEPDFCKMVDRNNGRTGYIRVFDKSDYLIIHGKNRSLPFQGAGCTSDWKQSVFVEIAQKYDLECE